MGISYLQKKQNKNKCLGNFDSISYGIGISPVAQLFIQHAREVAKPLAKGKR